MREERTIANPTEMEEGNGRRLENEAGVAANWRRVRGVSDRAGFSSLESELLTNEASNERTRSGLKMATT